jgi:hypothetical protein
MRFRIVWLALPVKNPEEDTYTGVPEMVTIMNQMDKRKITFSRMDADLFQSFALGCMQDGFAGFELA